MNTDARELVERAFNMARNSGKPDWQRMTTAVLKNRLLTLTKGAFKESDYGSQTILEFVQHAGDLISIDHSQSPPIVELTPVAPSQIAPPSPTSYDRIRPDLWQAIMDYTSGNKYSWDPVQGLARPQDRDDSAQMLMPTIDLEQDMKWRKEFAATINEPLDQATKGRLATFEGNSVSPKVLPWVLQWKWNDFVKAKIIETLSDWFQQQKLTPPERLTVSVRRIPRSTSDESVEQLREILIRSVKAMSPAELLAVSLPPAAVLRAHKVKS